MFPVKRQVIVATRTGKAFRGVLWARRWGYVVLRRVELLEPKAPPVAVDGEVVIERSNVDFIQVV
jgi:small nuclear ribonucleoprotein (snRNP)-like protein